MPTMVIRIQLGKWPVPADCNDDVWRNSCRYVEDRIDRRVLPRELVFGNRPFGAYPATQFRTEQ